MTSTLLKLFAAVLLLPPLAAAVRSAQDGKAKDCELLPQSRKFDEYGDLSADEEKQRLEKLAAALAAEDEEKGTKAFIIGYAGRDSRAGDGLARADRARKTLTEGSFQMSFYNTRVNTLDCGRREAPATEIWMTPAGAAPPRCAPTLDPAPAKGGAARPRPRRGSGRL